MPRKQWLQEYECEFLGTGDTFVDGIILSHLAENVSSDYYIKYNNRMRVWKDPEPYYEYIIGVDTALGRDRDYSAFQVVNLYNGEVVAEFYSNKTTVDEFSAILNKEGIYYNLANMVVERNTIGNHVVDLLYNKLEYENLWHDEKGLAGFQITAKNRDVILSELEEAIRTNVLKINSERTLNELNTFVITDAGKITADRGRHDDLIMSLSLANHIMKDTREGSFLEIKNESAFKQENMYPIKNKMPIISHGGPKVEDLTWLMK
jgi:RNase P/RNase MRP subunit POP5